jgi:hypothetical protein
MPFQRIDLGSGEDIPELDRLIGTARGQRLPIRGKRHAEHFVLMAPERGQFPVLGDAPQTRRIIVAARSKPLAIGRKRQTSHSGFMPSEPGDLLARGKVPELDGGVVTAGGQDMTIR